MFDDEVRALHRKLICGPYREREEAILSLRLLNPTDIETLAKYEMAQLRRSELRLRSFMAALLISLGLILIAAGAPSGALTLVLWSLLGLVWLVVAIMRGRMSRVGIADALASSRDPRMVPACLSLLEGITALRGSFTSRSSRTEHSLRLALKTLLPRVEHSETLDWSDQQRHALLLAFDEPLFDVDLTLQTLRVIAFAGNKSALPSLRKLSQLRGDGENSRIRQAAIQALPALEERLSQTAEQDQLLRPAQPMDIDVLLRPAVNAATVDEANLLHPIGRDE
jgi:hypothetical protein